MNNENSLSVENMQSEQPLVENDAQVTNLQELSDSENITSQDNSLEALEADEVEATEELVEAEENEMSEETDVIEEETVTEETEQALEPIAEEADAQEQESGEEAETVQTIPYHERYYLKYRDGKRTEPLDLDGTIAFLQGIGFDGGELRQARQGKNISEEYLNNDKSKNNQMFCSYCGTEIAGVEFYRLPDGRKRCTTCSKSVVKSKADIEEICQRVISNMDSFFGANINVPVSIEVTEERKLKKKVGVPLGTMDDQSILILGVAINKKKKYSIILENGAPRISLIATFAHELTHIWQYTHWDDQKNFKKCSKDKRLLIYEGMAKWAEIQYLYLIGETNIAKREEYITRNREDEYGIGFRLYEDQYPLTREAMTCENTPFTPNAYPLD